MFQSFLDSMPAIFLPDCSADDVRDFIEAALSVKLSSTSTSIDIDEKFTEKLYWIDVEKLLLRQVPSQDLGLPGDDPLGPTR